MYGWRGRIGLIIASTSAVAEMETFKMLPDGVSAHFSRIPYAGTGTDEAASKMLSELESSARLLAGSTATIGVDVLGFMHGNGSASSKPGFDRSISDRMLQATGVPSITMSSAVVDALKKFSIKRISTGVPLSQPEMLQKIKSFFETNGFEVPHVGSLPLKTHLEVSCQPPETAFKFIKSLNYGDVDAIVVNNANLRTIEVIDALESDLGKLVITGNQALIWACLRKLGINESLPHLGRLFKE
ncbi:MAG: maleate cis-trans isomerase family protein [Nitrososphaerales archaeon]